MGDRDQMSLWKEFWAFEPLFLFKGVLKNSVNDTSFQYYDLKPLRMFGRKIYYISDSVNIEIEQNIRGVVLLYFKGIFGIKMWYDIFFDQIFWSMNKLLDFQFWF